MKNRRVIGGEVINRAKVEGEVFLPREVVDKDYEVLDNKPAINGHVLIGDQTSEDLEIGATIKSDLNTTVTVGGCESGSEYLQGTELEAIVRDILSPTLYPRLTNPSASMSATGDKLLECGSTLDTVVTVSFNRGVINPAYGTSGYRSGSADTYSLNGGEPQASNSFFYTVDESHKTLQSVVTYLEGEQPKDSNGDDYDEPLPAGSVTSTPINYEFVNAFWSNTASIGTIAKNALVSYSAKSKEFSFPTQTAVNPEVFDVPGELTITAIETLNPLSGKWENVSREFNTSHTVHQNAASDDVTYTRYTDNRGYNAGPRQVRIKWN